MQVTNVWQRNWDAIHCDIYRDADGIPILDDFGNQQRAVRYIINEGSSRSSKTYSLIDCLDLYARSNERKRITTWRDTQADCRDTVLNDTIVRLQMTDRYELEQTFNKTLSIFAYDTTSKWEFRGTDETKKVHGLTQAVAWFNEPYKISRAVFDQIDQRTSDVIIIDWNPREAHWIDDLKKDPRALVIHSTFKDNPFCPQESAIKILAYQPVKRCALVETKLLTEQEALRYDTIANPQGFPLPQIRELARCQGNEEKRSANDFNWDVYGLGQKGERPNRIFHWNEIPLSKYQSIDATENIGCDWGTVDPWAIVACKYYDGALYFRELNYDSENVLRGKLSNTDLSQIASVGGSEEERQENVGLVTWRFNVLQIPKNIRVICDTNRPLKGNALRRAGWQAIPAIKAPGSIVDGIDLLNNYPCYFTSDSPNIKTEQELYSRQVDRYGEVLEEPEDTYNHLMDACRYVAADLQKRGIIRMV